MSRGIIVAAVGVALPAACALAQGPPASVGVVTRPDTFEVSGVALPVEAGRLTVPANRTSGSDATLTLGFIRFPSTAAAPGAPIVFLAGGPGDAATRAFRGMPLDFLDALRGAADVIAFDQRGTGTSGPANPWCPPGEGVPRDRPADPGAVLTGLRRRVGACLADAAHRGVDVAGLTTAESADDLEDLRRALGVPRLAYLAGSYGTHLALAAARRHPAAVDRMVLAGVEGPDHTLKLPSEVDTVLARLAAARRPTLLAELRALRAKLAREPARFTFPGGRAIVLGEWDLQRWIAGSLDDVREMDAVLGAIPAMQQGDFGALGRWALRQRLPRPLNLMNLAMDCASYASADRLARIAREAPNAVLGDVINFPLPGLCTVPGLPRLPDRFREPLVSGVPALLVSGTLDGRTPVQNAVEVAAGLRHARQLVIEGAAHGLFRDEEVREAVLAFLRPSR